ncbi:MAG: dcoH1 [Acidobacteria bacterium]|nr:dcoH1 [Acidobacteriota bacterium]
MRTKLSAEQMAAVLGELDGWTFGENKLQRTFQFPDFAAAFSFMTAAAGVAEQMDHHPDWCNSYSTVRVDLSTHDAGGVTSKDVELAKAMNTIAATGSA